MPMNKKDYPPNWEKMAKSVKDEVNWVCEQCKKPCCKPGVNWDDFTQSIKGTKWHKESFEDIGEFGTIEKPGRFILTVSHKNHIPLDCRRENLQALCSVCHLRFDAPHHAQTRRANKRKAQEMNGQLNFFTNN